MKQRYLIALLAAALAGCHRSYPDEKKADTFSEEKLVNVNRNVVHDESKAITDFIERHGWKMEMTGTGLRYEIYEKGNGRMAGPGSVLSVAYKAYLLDGTLCYEANDSTPLQLVTGRGDQINGLEEGLMMMHEGDRARFVIPNHLAYGITGDQDKIPPASPLYYDVHLVRVTAIPKQK
jgi:FKBP-type peptidyl-prolyl cis-trans isomerase FkpA